MNNRLNKRAGFGRMFKLNMASDSLSNSELEDFSLLGTSWAVGLVQEHQPSVRGTLSKDIMDEALEIIKHDTDSSED